MRMPDAEVACTVDLVRALLADQHPDLTALPLRDAGEGWDNRLFRLGADLLVRLPRRQLAAATIEHEQRWLPLLAPTLPAPVPCPVRIGRPACGFPWNWSIVPWFPGRIAAPDVPDGLHCALAAFLIALHQPAPADAPTNVYRTTLASRSAAFEKHLAVLTGRPGAVDRAALQESWDDALGAPAWRGPALWIHGDLHPANVIVSDQGLAAVIDFGDLTSGDPAVDLAVAWMLWPPATRTEFRAAVDAASVWTDDGVWRRARGWALALGVALLANSDDNPVMHAIGYRTVAEVLEADA